MNTNFQKIALATSLVTCLVACQPNKQTLQKNDILHVTANDQMDSESLTNAGEQLLSPYTFMLADRAFDMSLAKDPGNQKAIFYKSFLKRFMALKGVYKRMRPLEVKNGSQAHYDENFNKIPNSPLKSFFADGSEDAATEETVLKILTDYRNGADEFRRYVKKNPDLNITLNLNPYVWENRINKNFADSCKVQDTDNGFEVNCDSTGIAQTQLSAADMVVLGQEAAGEVLWLTPYTSYNAQGVAKLMHDQDQNVNHTPKEIFAYLESQTDFGKLRNDQSLTLLPELGSDLSAAAKWALQYQTKLCPTGSDSSQNRPGFLFNEGVCMGNLPAAQAQIAQLDVILAGVAWVSLTRNSNGFTEEAHIDAMAIARKPIADLRSVAPATFDSCGYVTSLRDKTLGGIFVDQNAERFVLDASPCSTTIGLK